MRINSHRIILSGWYLDMMLSAQEIHNINVSKTHENLCKQTRASLP